MTKAATRREALLALLAAAPLLLALVPGAMAGTADDPEVTDPADDLSAFTFGNPQGATGQATGATGAAGGADVVAGWIEEDASNLTFAAQVSGDLEGLVGEGVLADYAFHFVTLVAGVTKDLIVTVDAAGLHPDPGLSASLDGSVLRLSAPKALLTAEEHGTTVAFYISSACRFIGVGDPAQIVTGIQVLFTDRAPDADNGRNYTTQFSVGGSLGDADADGLNDTYEVNTFGDLAAANATGDNDNDGLNNSAEQAAGTDPTKFDTDGDGLNDKADAFPLDPTKPVDGDGDGLNDTWERSYYNQTSRYSGSDDPDKDNLTNLQEQAKGSNPLKGDTDGDAVRDDKDAFPTDATRSAASGKDLDGDGSASTDSAKPELYAGAAMFAAAATFCLLGLARGL